MKLINPKNNLELNYKEDYLYDSSGDKFYCINGIYRFTEKENYTSNFSYQWNRFQKTQIDINNSEISSNRLLKETNWNLEKLENLNILEVGSGAGRFSNVILEKSKANLYSIDYSNSVESNYKNNEKYVNKRLFLYQASIYEMPFLDNAFDKVLCLGVLQHTPDFEKSVIQLIKKLKINGELVIDFYPMKGFWTKIHSKYILRKFTKKMSNHNLLNLIDKNLDIMIKISKILNYVKLGFLTRFVPIVDLNTLPKNLTIKEYREWVLLDTFDMFSPAYDNPQYIKIVEKIFIDNKVKVTFSGFINYTDKNYAAVVRGIKC